MQTVNLISYNVNGIRAATKRGFVDWLQKEDIDIVCIQELKAQIDQIDIALFEKLGYKHYWFPAEKKGYSGVGILSTIEPDNVGYGMGIEKYDREGRVLRADFGNITLLSTYFPSGSSGDERQGFKMEFLKDYFNFIQNLKKTRPNIILSGDYNICHKAIDIHNPIGNKNSSGFLPEERAWMDQFFDSGFIDTFRHFNKNPHHYSWWSYRANARANNKGWRIDYNAVTIPMKDKILEARILSDVYHSDHCPVFLKVNF